MRNRIEPSFMDDTNLVAICTCDNELTILEPGRKINFRCSDIVQLKTLLSELKSSKDVDSVQIVVDAYGVVYDIRINDLSIGYLATSTYCQRYELEQRPYKYHGEYTTEQIEEIVRQEDGVSIVPLFAETGDPV